MKESLAPFGSIMHEMQKERGCVILYLCSNWALDDDGMHQKFQNTDKTVEALKTNMSNWFEAGQIDENQFDKIKNVLSEIDKLSTQRELVLAREISATDSISVYSHKVIGPIIDLMVEMALSDPDHDSSRVSAFSNFLYLKERIGRERALGARGLVLGAFSNEEFIENYKFLVSEQEGYKETFFALATDKQKACYDPAYGRSIG